jgi:hypothetical protein
MNPAVTGVARVYWVPDPVRLEEAEWLETGVSIFSDS